MKLIAWNVQRKSVGFVEELLKSQGLEPDLLVLSEVKRPEVADNASAVWIGGEGPGLAVIVREGLTIHPEPENEGAPPYVRAFAVRGKVNFRLIAGWPVKRGEYKDYHKILMESLARFCPTTCSGPTVFAGDLNTSTGVQTQEKTHPAFVARAAEHGLVSAYHHHSGEGFGRESTPTYLDGSRKGMGFHIDYCFVSSDLLGSTRVVIPRPEGWPKASDHLPLIVDIQDTAFARQGGRGSAPREG